MNILLVAVNAKYIHSNPAVHSLKCCAKEYASLVVIKEFTINQEPSHIVREIYKARPDVIAFSCYIWNRTIIGQIIGDLLKILPDVDIWAGGPEVSFHTEQVLKEWRLRGILAGPGEGAFSRLVSAYVDGTAARLPAVLDASNSPRLPLDEIPFWYDDLTDFTHRIIYYESSRGCPFSCSYCLSSIDKTMEFRSVSRVLPELDFFLRKNVPQVKFIDRTFNCSKKHALPILQYLSEHDNGITNFHFEIAADLLDEDYFALLKNMRQGAIQLEIGVQSTCPETIAAIERHTDFSKIAAAVTRIRSFQNIHIHLDLIAGLPYEDLATFKNSFHDVYALRPHQLQLGFLKVLKGSAMELRAPEYDLLYTSQPPYEVLATRWLSYDDIRLLKQVEKVVEIYYNSGQFTHTLRFLQPFFDSPFAMYESLAGWYETHHLSDIQSSRVRKYEILLSFSCSRLSDRLDEKLLCSLKESLTYDLYLREPMKNRPAFALSLTRWKDDIRNLLMEESVSHDLFAHYADCSYRELAKQLHIEVFTSIFPVPTAVLFDYHSRDPLTNNCAAIQKPLKLS